MLEKAAQRQAVRDQIASIEERLQARRSRLVQALHAFAATFPTSGPGGVELPTQDGWLESVADALLAVCQAVRDGGFSQGLEEILSSDREDAGDNDRLAIALYRLGWCNDRQGILALLEQLARLPKREDNLDRSAACQAQVWAAVQAWFGAFLPWPPVPGTVHFWHPDYIEIARLADEVKPRPSQELSQRPAPTGLPPLVGEKAGRREALPELARDSNRERQSRYCQGFAPDWWLPALVCPKWRTRWYPLEPTPESVEQWMEFIDKLRVEYLGPFDMPLEAAKLEADRESDLALIREHRPDLYAAVTSRLVTPHGKPGEQAAASDPIADRTNVAPALPAEETVESPPQQAVEVDPPNTGLTFLPGAFAYLGHRQPLNGKPLEVLQALNEAQGKTLTLAALRDKVWTECLVGEETIRSAVGAARKALRSAIKATGGDDSADPLPAVDRGTHRTAWRLALP
jgi:hypothetical protein